MSVAEAFVTLRPDTDEFASGIKSKLGGVTGLLAGLGAAATAAFAGAFKIGDTFDKAYDKIRIGTGATGDVLEGLKDEFRDVASTIPASFDDASTAIADLNTRLGLTGDPLEEISGQFLNLARITGGDVATQIQLGARVFGDWGVEADKQTGTLDRLFRAAQASGATFDDLAQKLVQFGAPLRNVGFSLDESTALLAGFERAGVNTETVIAGLRQGVGKLAKAGEDVPDTFRRVVDEIEAMGPGTEATSKAIELFGQRSGPDLADAIAGGKFAVDDMLAAISGGSDTIQKASDDTASFSESWQVFKNQAMLALEPIATRVFQLLSDGMAWLSDAWAEHGEAVTAGIVGFGETVRSVFEFVADFIRETIDLVSSILSDPDITSDGWVGFVERVVVAFVFLRDGVTEVFEVVRGWVTSIADWFTSSSDDISATTSGLFDHLSAVWDQIVAIIQSAVDAIVAVVTWFVEIVQEFWDRFGTHIVAFWTEIWDAAVQIVSGVFDVIQGIFETFAGIFTGDWDRFLTGVKQIFQGIWDAIVGIFRAIATTLSTAVGALMAAISQIWSSAWNAVKTFFSNLISNVMEKARSWMSSLRTAISNGIAAVVGFFRDLPGNVVSAIGNVASLLLSKGRDILDGLWDGIKAIWESVRSWFGSLGSKITGAVGNLGGILVGAGKAILDGLWSGLKSKWEGLKSWVGGLGGKIKNLKGPLSYDRTMLTDEGRAIISGLADGMQKAWPQVEDTLGSMTSRLSNVDLSTAVDVTGRRVSGRPPTPQIRVWIGDRELTDVVVEQVDGRLENRSRQMRAAHLAGAV